MKLLTSNVEYTETINLAINLQGEYSKSVIFHCYWHGTLNEKHLYSILSCYYFNVHKNKHKIILWLENNTPNEYNSEISKYAEIKYFSLSDEKANTNFIENYNCNFNSITYYSDFIRNLLLYNYGGVWFDLDCFILRSFDPLFIHFQNEICVYRWEYLNIPNNAIYISLEPKSNKMKKNIEFIINKNKGFGFLESNLTFDLELDLLVLPCSWFDPNWINNPIANEKDFRPDWDAQNGFDVYGADFLFEKKQPYLLEINQRASLIPNVISGMLSVVLDNEEIGFTKLI
jgi:hypothetical protein